jgi:hypothetical protein
VFLLRAFFWSLFNFLNDEQRQKIERNTDFSRPKKAHIFLVIDSNETLKLPNNLSKNSFD